MMYNFKLELEELERLDILGYVPEDERIDVATDWLNEIISKGDMTCKWEDGNRLSFTELYPGTMTFAVVSDKGEFVKGITPEMVLKELFDGKLKIEVVMNLYDFLMEK